MNIVRLKIQTGGLSGCANASSIPRLSQAHKINRKRKQNGDNSDPILQLYQKQKRDGVTGHPIICRISVDEYGASIALFDDRIVHDIENFSCTETKLYKLG